MKLNRYNYQLYHKYMRLAMLTKSKPRRKKLLNRAKKYQIPFSELRRIADILAAPLRVGVLSGSILNDIFQVEEFYDICRSQ